MHYQHVLHHELYLKESYMLNCSILCTHVTTNYTMTM